MKLNWLKQNYNLDQVNPTSITYRQYKEIEEIMVKSGFYKTDRVEPTTIDNLVGLAKNLVFKRDQKPRRRNKT